MWQQKIQQHFHKYMGVTGAECVCVCVVVMHGLSLCVCYDNNILNLVYWRELSEPFTFVLILL